MFYAELILAGLSLLFFLIILIFIFIKKFSLRLHKIFSLAALITIVLLLLIVIKITGFTAVDSLVLHRLIYAMLLMQVMIVGFLLQVYPLASARNLLLSSLTSVPGLALFIITLITDYIMPSGAPDIPLKKSDGAGYPLFLIFITAYSAFSLTVLFIKSKMTITTAFKRDMTYLFYSMVLLLAAMFSFAFYLPYYLGYDRFFNITAITAGALTLSAIFYAIYDLATVDMKKLYVSTLYWTLIFSILFAPVLMTLRYNYVVYSDEKIPSVGIAIMLFVYLFLIFKYIKPRIESFFQRGYRNLSNKLDILFSPISQLSISSGEITFWDEFFKIMINGLVENFNINGANFYLHSNKDKKFIFSYGFGKIALDTEVKDDNPLIQILNADPAIIYKPEIHYRKEYREHRNEILDFFQRNATEVIIPFVNHERHLVGLMALGPLQKKKMYSKTFLSILELYRLQFQHHLSNALIIENVKSSQAHEHDRMVIQNIKRKIIPENLNQTKGFRISSFYINNSKYGGDYYDSIKLSDERMALFICDSSYSGIESALISLELYTILHTQLKRLESPDEILKIMNWVISTSRFSNKYAPAFCMILSPSGEIQFSTAAYNPMIIFNHQDGSFIEQATKGIPIGVEKDSVYVSASIKPAKGSIGFLYSDGLITAINEAGETYSIGRVKDIIRLKKDQSPSVITRDIFNDFKNFTKDKQQINDVSIIILKSL